MLGTTLAAVILHNELVLVMEIVGYVVQNAICIILPCGAMLRLGGTRVHWLTKDLLRVLILLFTAYMAVGLWSIPNSQKRRAESTSVMAVSRKVQPHRT